MTLAYDEYEKDKKPPEPQPGSSPTIAPTQGDMAVPGGKTLTEGFGFAPQATTTSAPQPAPAAQNFGFGATATQAPVPGSTQGYLEGGLNTWLQTPSRYDSDVVQQGASVIEASLNKMRKQGQRAIGEQAASRGLVGSSLEAENTREFEEELQRQGSERLFNLQREQANTYGADRGASINAGLGFGNQSLSMLGMGLEDQRMWAAMEQDAGFQNKVLELQNTGMNRDEAYRTAALDWQREYGRGELGVRKEGAQSQYNLALATLLMNAPPELMADPAIKQWIASQFGGGGGGNFGFTGTTSTSGGTSNGDGMQEVRSPFGFGATANMVMPPTGGFPGTPTTPTPPANSGYSPVPFVGRGASPIVSEAQRRLGMTGGTGAPSTPGAPATPLPPMPNGVTSPVPGQGSPGPGGYGFPGAGTPSGPQITPPAGTPPAQRPPYDPASGPPILQHESGSGTAGTQAEFEAQRQAYLDELRRTGQITPEGGNANAKTIPLSEAFITQSTADDPFSSAEQTEYERVMKILRGY